MIRKEFLQLSSDFSSDLTFRNSHFAHNSLWGDHVRVMTTPHDGRCYFCTEFPGVDATNYPGLGGEVFRMI